MIQVSGITGAGPIFKRVMTKAMKDVVPRSLVDRSGLELVSICPLSGQVAGPNCPAAMEELFIPGTAPTHRCEMHGELSASLSPELKQQCLQLAASQGRLVDLGLDFYDWAKNEGLASEPWLAAACMGAGERDGDARVLNPTNGGEFLLLSDLPLADQAIPVRVRASSSAGPLAVWVDGERAMELKPPFTGHLPATQGKHVMEVRDRTGALLDTVKFVVRR
jgi:penicillin-binding protein 1C